MKTPDIINDDLLSLAKKIIELREQAVFLFGNGDLREALSIYDDLIYIKETFFTESLYTARWDILYQLGDEDWAIDDFKKASSINPDNQYATEWLSWLLENKL